MGDRKETEAAYLIFVALSTVMYFFDMPTLSAGDVWYHRLTYMFAHGNIFHLFANMYCMLLFAYKMRQPLICLPLSLICAACAPVMWNGSVAGCSGMCFFMSGWNVHIVRDKKNYILISLGIIGIGFLFPNLCASVHLFCFIIGYLISWNYNKYETFFRRTRGGIR